MFERVEGIEEPMGRRGNPLCFIAIDGDGCMSDKRDREVKDMICFVR